MAINAEGKPSVERVFGQVVAKLHARKVESGVVQHCLERVDVEENERLGLHVVDFEGIQRILSSAVSVDAWVGYDGLYPVGDALSGLHVQTRSVT